MNSREFRDAINKIKRQESLEWNIYGDGHKYANNLTLSDMDYFLVAIHEHQPTTLGLANLKINDEQVSYLMHRLHDNRSLQTLYLPFNEIGDKGAAAIADLLAKNTNIHTLILFNNKIGNFGMAALANMLFNNSRLKKIKLFENAFNNKASFYFEIAMRHNSSVTTLLLYPADGGIQLKPRENYDEEQRERMIAFFKKQDRMIKTQHLMKVNNVQPDESDAYRKLVTRQQK